MRETSHNLARLQSPQFERIVPAAGESFVWRIDDYPWHRSVWNCHPEVEIHLIRQSSGTALIGDFVGEFMPGDLTIVGSWLPHDWISHCRPGQQIVGRDLVIQFDAKAMEGAATIFPEISAINDLLERAASGVRFTPTVALAFASAMENLGKLSGAKRFGAFLSLLAEMAATPEYQILSGTRMSSIRSKELQKMQAIFSFIQSNLMGDVSLARTAEISEMTETSLSRFFKKRVGQNYAQFITLLRISKACALLATTNETVSTIAFECGYENISNFNRRFLLLRRCTPSEYRRVYLQDRNTAKYP